ncbi:PH domain-containing protein [Xanthobacter sp. AM11]|uniref:PH domain-containing protein n=1 Tax=Xanthobacter sp. AM11 TaxID=3380643 RepID=UPI0039BF309A
MDLRLAGRLLRGERVLWTGRPRPGGMVFMPEDFVPVLISIFLAAGLAFAIFGGLAGRPRPFGRNYDLLVFVGIWTLIYGSRFVLDAYLRRHTWYVVTDRRILILQEGWLPRVLAIDRARLAMVELEQWPNAVNIVFEYVPTNPRDPRALVPSLHPSPRFLALADARAVFDLIERTKPAVAAATPAPMA